MIDIYNTKNKTKNKKLRQVYDEMRKKWEKNEIPIWVFRQPTVLRKPTYVKCGFWTHICTGVGFTGTGAGWTLPTCAIPMCHPSTVQFQYNPLPQPLTALHRRSSQPTTFLAP